MSYQVIARKWRPQSFEEVTGQEAITRTLANSIRNRRLHHAFIFSGPRGVGKTTTARILAKALNCAVELTDRPCGTCSSCREIATGSSIDVLEIDAASHTGVDNVREVIISNVGLSPARDRYRIYIIDEFHQLSVPAFNALLKTLEEPPPHAIFIMATTELHKVPDTVLSRCQVFEFKLIPEAKIVERLRLIAQSEGARVSDAALHRIAAAGEGSMRDAQSLFDQVIGFSGSEISEADAIAALGIVEVEFLRRTCAAIAAHDSKAILEVVDNLVNQGYDLRNFCRELMAYFRNLLVFKAVGKDTELLPIDDSEIPAYQAQSSMFSEAELVRGFHLLTDVEQSVRLSPEPRFQVEIGLLKLSELGRLRPLAELIARLEKLEKGVSGGSRTETKSSPLAETTNPRPFRTAAPRNRPAPQARAGPIRPPEAPPAQSSGVANSGEAEPQGRTFDEGVENLLSALAEHGKRLLVGEMRHASSITFDGAELRLTYPVAHKSHMQALDDREARRIVESVAGKVMNHSIKLVLISEGEERPNPELAKTRAAALDDPLVQAVLQKFKGEIIEVTDLEKGQ